MTTRQVSQRTKDVRAGEHVEPDLLPACPRCGDLTDAGAERCAGCRKRLLPYGVERYGLDAVPAPTGRTAEDTQPTKGKGH